MTYIDRLNAFFQWLDINPLPVTAQVMYIHLLHLCNRAFWPDKLHVSNSKLMKSMGIGSHNTLADARKALCTAGLIQCEQGSRTKETDYILCPMPIMSLSDTMSNSDMSKTDIMSKSDHLIDTTLSSYININKQKDNKDTYGTYGWVKLSEKEYQKLVSDLGLQELNWCLNFVDESAQTTNNKNKWKDWNLVIRKCSREKWGGKSRETFDRQNAAYSLRPEFIPNYD